MSVLSLLDLRLALGLDQAITTDDYELQAAIDGAEAEYVERVGPAPGTYTKTVTLPHFLPRGVTSVTVPAGVVWDEEKRQLYRSYWSRLSVEVTYVVGDWPMNHRQAILADVAEYWDRTQRTGGDAGRPGFGDGFDDGGRGPRPVTMYPRIRALATGSFA